MDIRAHVMLAIGHELCRVTLAIGHELCRVRVGRII